MVVVICCLCLYRCVISCRHEKEMLKVSPKFCAKLKSKRKLPPQKTNFKESKMYVGRIFVCHVVGRAYPSQHFRNEISLNIVQIWKENLKLSTVLSDPNNFFIRMFSCVMPFVDFSSCLHPFNPNKINDKCFTNNFNIKY